MKNVPIVIGEDKYYFSEVTHDWMNQDIYKNSSFGQGVQVPLESHVYGGLRQFPLVALTDRMTRDLEAARSNFRQINGMIPSLPDSEKPEVLVAFYMIYLEGGGAPTYQHDNRESAKAEAKRLAKLHGRPAYILEAKTKINAVVSTNFYIKNFKPLPENDPYMME